MICKLNKNEVFYPCSRNCPLFGDCVVEYEKQNKKPITNFDRIKAMSVEEMAEYICGIQEAPCHCCHYQKETASCGGGYDTSICRAGVVKMLESEVQTDDR